MALVAAKAAAEVGVRPALVVEVHGVGCLGARLRCQRGLSRSGTSGDVRVRDWEAGRTKEAGDGGGDRGGHDG